LIQTAKNVPPTATTNIATTTIAMQQAERMTSTNSPKIDSNEPFDAGEMKQKLVESSHCDTKATLETACQSSPFEATSVVLPGTRMETTALHENNVAMACGSGGSISDEEASQSDDDDDSEGEERGMLLLPGRPPISDECAICLEWYRLGDSIVWSTNHDCQHVFHQDCLVCYCVTHEEKKEAARPHLHGTFRQQQQQLMEHQRNKGKREPIPCPICRRPFDFIAASSSANGNPVFGVKINNDDNSQRTDDIV
jgi:RING-type zinc-finger